MIQETLFDAARYGESVLHVEIHAQKPEIAALFSDIKEGLEFLESRAFQPEVKAAAERQAAWMRTRFWKLAGVKRWTAKRVRELQSFNDQVQAAFENIGFEDYRIDEGGISK